MKRADIDIHYKTFNNINSSKHKFIQLQTKHLFLGRIVKHQLLILPYTDNWNFLLDQYNSKKAID